MLVTFGARLLREVSDPTVVAVFRLAIAEAERTPKVAQALDTTGRAALTEVLTQARSSGLLEGDPAEMAEQLVGPLWGNLTVSLLLGVADPPNPGEIKRRARNPATALLRLYPPPAKPLTSAPSRK